MAMNNFIQNEVIRKAKAGEQLAQSTPEKMALYNQYATPKPQPQQPVQPVATAPKPTTNWSSQIQSPQFGYGNTTQKVGYTDRNAEIQRTQNVLNQRKQAGMDVTDQLSHYRNLTGKDYSFSSPMTPTQTNPMWQRKDNQFYGDVDLNFNKWDDLDSIQNQMTRVGAAIGGYSMKGDTRGENARDLWNYYNVLHDRAGELGYKGAMLPGIANFRQGDFVSAFDRGFGDYANSRNLRDDAYDTFTKRPYELYLNQQLKQLGVI